MGFEFKIEGLDQAKKMLDKMVQDLEPDGFGSYANKIEKTAKELCNDPECKRIKFKPAKGKTSIDISVTDKEALECLRKAISQHKNSMSQPLKLVYEKIVKEQFPKLEKQLTENQ